MLYLRQPEHKLQQSVTVSTGLLAALIPNPMPAAKGSSTQADTHPTNPGPKLVNDNDPNLVSKSSNTLKEYNPPGHGRK